MGDYCALNAKAAAFLVDEFDILEFGKTFGYVNAFISLHYLSLNPGVALKRIGCQNIDEVLQTWAYACGFSGGLIRHSVVPLGVITTLAGLRKYAQAFETHVGEGSSNYLHVLPDDSRFHEYNLYEPRETATDPMYPWPERRYDVTRFEQLFAGSGYTLEMLSAGHRDMNLRPVQLKLSNEDILLAYAYKDLSS